MKKLALIFVLIGSAVAGPDAAQADHGPGVEICKTLASGSTLPYNFQFQVGSQVVNVPAGGCTNVQIPLNVTTTITEVADPLFQVMNITVTPLATQAGPVNLAARSVPVRLTLAQPSSHVRFINRAAPNTGLLVLCKAYQGQPPPNSSWQLNGGGWGTGSSGPGCTPARIVAAGNTTVSESVSSNTSLVGIATVPSNRLVTTNLAAMSAVVEIVAGQTTTVIFTNTANAPPLGQIRVCKVAGQGVALGTPFTFTLNGNPVTVPAGSAPTGNCSEGLPFASGTNVNVHENVPANVQVVSIVTNPAGALVGSTLATGDAVVQAGPAGTVTTVTYTNRAVPPEQGLLKVCKIAGPGVAVGTPFTFTASGVPFTVSAGSASAQPPGNCVIVGLFPVGGVVLVDENVPSGTQVDEISVDPPSAVVGSPDLTAGSVAVTIGPGVTEVTYTNKRTGFLEVCKIGQGPGVTGSFQFGVAGQLFTVAVNECTGPIEVPAGQVTVTEVFRPGFQAVNCTTFPVGALVTNCNQPNQTALVNVAFGGIQSQTALTFVNRSVTPGAAAQDVPASSDPESDASLVSSDADETRSSSVVSDEPEEDEVACEATASRAAGVAAQLAAAGIPEIDGLEAAMKRLDRSKDGMEMPAPCSGG